MLPAQFDLAGDDDGDGRADLLAMSPYEGNTGSVGSVYMLAGTAD